MSRIMKVAAIGVALVVLPLAGCSGATKSETPEGMDLGAVSIAEYDSVTAVLDPTAGTVQLPLDRYQLSESANSALMNDALNVLASDCLVEAGYAPLNAPRTQPGGPVEDRLFGRWSVSLAEKYGTDPDPRERSSLIDTSAQGAEYTEKYQHCYDAAKEKIGDHLDALTAPGIAYKISYNAYEAVLKDSAGKAAVEKSLGCMEDKGITVQRENGAGPSDDYRTQPSEEQLRVATLAARCRMDTGAIQTLYDLDARYQSAYIAQYEAQLTSQSDSMSAHVDALEKIVAGTH